MIIETVIPVFLIILVSYIIAKFKKINTDPLVKLIIYITAPALAFYSIAQAKFALDDFFLISLSALSVILGAGLIAYLLFRAFKLKFKGFYLPLMFMNSGNMGYPITFLAFGAIGLSKAVVYNVVTGILVYSLGIYLADKKSDIKEIFRLPLIYATILGTALSFLRVHIPEIIMKPIIIVGDATIPLSLIVLGFTIATIKMKSYKFAVIGSLIRFGLGFSLALGCTYLFGITGISRSVIILISVMPSAFSSFVISQLYKTDEDIVASTVLLSTILSIIIIPLVLYIL